MKTSSLSSIGTLFGKSWAVYKKRWKTLIGLYLLPIIIGAAAFAAILGVGLIISPFVPLPPVIPIGLAALIGASILIWISSWGTTSLLVAIVDEGSNLKSAIKKAEPRVLSYMWLTFLLSFLILGSFLLFVVPGIIFVVWFIFAAFIFIDKDLRGMNALFASKEYVRGRWLDVFVRLLAVMAVFVLISLAPIIGALVNILLTPFIFVYIYQLYLDLKSVSGEINYVPTQKQRFAVIGTGVLGILILPIIVVFLGGAMFFMPLLSEKFRELKQPPVDITVAPPSQNIESTTTEKASLPSAVAPTASTGNYKVAPATEPTKTAIAPTTVEKEPIIKPITSTIDSKMKSTQKPYPGKSVVVRGTEKEEGSGHAIQAGSFLVKNNAESRTKELKEAGYKAYINEVELFSKHWYRVKTGPYQSTAKAHKAAAEIKKNLKIDCIVTTAKEIIPVGH